MRCPKCDHTKSLVVESRKSPEDENLRKRYCLKCNHTFITKEVLHNGLLRRADQLVTRKMNNNRLFERKEDGNDARG